MDNKLLTLLDSFRPLKILKVLSFFNNGVHVRELAAYCKLSPSSVSDTVKILTEYGLIKRRKKGNKVFLIYNSNDAESEFITLLLEQERKAALEESSRALSKKAIALLEWNSEMLLTINRAKKNATARII